MHTTAGKKILCYFKQDPTILKRTGNLSIDSISCPMMASLLTLMLLPLLILHPPYLEAVEIKDFSKHKVNPTLDGPLSYLDPFVIFKTDINVPLVVRVRPSLKNVLEILTNRETFDELIGKIIPEESPTLLKNVKLHECLNHFKNRYWNQPKDQLGGVQGTIYNYLNYFTNDDVAEVFCSDNTFRSDLGINHRAFASVILIMAMRTIFSAVAGECSISLFNLR